MRRTLAITATLGLALGLAAPALAASFAEVDANADGVISLQELQAVTPSVTQDQFNAYDENADGALIPSEFAKLEASMGDAERDQDSPN